MEIENKIWEIIESVKWEEKCNTVDSTKLKIELMKRYSQEEIAEANKMVSKLSNELYKCISRYEDEQLEGGRLGNYGGDDSFSDLLHHIVGSGKLVYEAVMADPVIAACIDFTESFMYVMPYDDDWNNLVPEYWIAKAEDCLESLCDCDKLNVISAEIKEELFSRFEKAKKGDFVGATEGFTVDIDPLRGYNRDLYNRYYEWDGNIHSAKYSNILTDMLKWQVEA